MFGEAETLDVNCLAEGHDPQDRKIKRWMTWIFLRQEGSIAAMRRVSDQLNSRNQYTSFSCVSAWLSNIYASIRDWAYIAIWKRQDSQSERLPEEFLRRLGTQALSQLPLFISLNETNFRRYWPDSF